MPMKRRKFIPGAVAGLAMALGVLVLPPASYAGDAVMLVPDENLDLPRGSQIPEHRIKEMEKKIGDYKKKMRAEARKKQQERAVKSQSPNPENKNP